MNSFKVNLAAENRCYAILRIILSERDVSAVKFKTRGNPKVFRSKTNLAHNRTIIVLGVLLTNIWLGILNKL